MASQNNITICGHDPSRMWFESPKGICGVAKWDATTRQLFFCGSNRPLTFSPAKAAELEAALKEFVPAKYETKMGYEMTEADRAKEGWEFVAVVDDTHGQYTRLVSAGTGSIDVSFAKTDLA